MSGYNIDWNISQAPEFNHMLGFSESDVRTMFRYYQDNGKLRADADIEAMMEEMKPWYNNYCFAQECLDETVFLTDIESFNTSGDFFSCRRRSRR
nr:AAA family ATPase [Phocaeicola salanitronis]